MATPSPKTGLSKAAAAWVDEMRAGWEYTPGEREILLVAAASWDRWRQAKALIDADGIVIYDRFDQARPHPACVVEHDSRSAFLVAMSKLHFEEAEQPHDVLQLPRRRRVA